MVLSRNSGLVFQLPVRLSPVMQPSEGCVQQGAWLRSGHLERKKTKVQRQVSVQEVGLHILVKDREMRLCGNRGHRENKRSESWGLASILQSV